MGTVAPVRQLLTWRFLAALGALALLALGVDAAFGQECEQRVKAGQAAAVAKNPLSILVHFIEAMEQDDATAAAKRLAAAPVPVPSVASTPPVDVAGASSTASVAPSGPNAGSNA